MITAPLAYLPPTTHRVARATKPSWSYAPTSGEGAARHGGRFNPRGVSALYTSFDFETCAREVRFGLNAEPYTFYFLDVESAHIVDLSSQHVRDQIGVPWSDIECSNWESEMHAGRQPSSHTVALALIALGVHGIVVPSFASQAPPGSRNLVLWRWALATEPNPDPTKGAIVTVLNSDLLPRDPSSWQQ